jgi:FAD:protein FMN transferase
MLQTMKEYEYNGKAMGTDISIAIISDSKQTADALANTAMGSITAYEKQFSRFLPDSELSILNRQKKMIVSEEFFHIIELAYSLFIATRGVFNPLVQIKRLGYTKTFTEIEHSDVSINTEPYDIDFSSTGIDRNTRSIILRRGQKIDLGGILKGYLAERISKNIKESPGIQGVIINIGGDIHTEGVDQDGKDFIFTIFNPITQAEDIAITLHNQSLATSGTYKRAWQTAQGIRNHILDIQGTDNPDSGIVSASVITLHGSTSEAYAKVFISVGEKEAKKILKNKPMSYILITTTGDSLTNI